jgi:hypothetical protein
VRAEFLYYAAGPTRNIVAARHQRKAKWHAQCIRLLWLTAITQRDKMANDNFSIDDVRKMAADIGMTRLNEGQLQELLRATRAARARRDTLATATLTYADEPAHVYSLVTGEQQ